jgi:outer membrane protein TolC
MKDSLRIAIFLSAALFLFGCTTSGFEPIPRQAVLRDVLESRRGGHPADPKASSAPAVSPFGGSAWSAGSELFASLLRRLERVNPDIRDARAACLAAERIARTGAPWEDPEVEVVPGRNAEGKPVWGSSAALNFLIPLGGHRGRERRLLAERVRAAAENRLAVEKEQAFALRSAYVGLLVAKAALGVAKENHDWARKGSLLARRIAVAGGASAVDVQIVETEERAARLASLEAENQLADERATVAELLLLSPTRLPEFPTLVSSPPPAPPLRREQLLKEMLAAAPELARLEAEYRIAGRGLGVELAKRVPDLSIGVEAEWEDGGEVGLALPFGFSLPLWNANREGVAAARAEKALALEAYRTGLDRAVASLDTLTERLERLGARRKVLVDEILPSHRVALADARRALEVSDFDPLQYVELERAHREWQASSIELLGEILETRIELERAVGAPLFTIPEFHPPKEKEK